MRETFSHAKACHPAAAQFWFRRARERADPDNTLPRHNHTPAEIRTTCPACIGDQRDRDAWMAEHADNPNIVAPNPRDLLGRTGTEDF